MVAKRIVVMAEEWMAAFAEESTAALAEELTAVLETPFLASHDPMMEQCLFSYA